MANKVDIPVVINGKVYTLSGYEGEDYLQNVATYINGKIAECKTSDQYRRMNTEYQGILLALNIADDYFKEKKQSIALESDVEEKDKEMYDLKHELISTQIKFENLERDLEKEKNENQQLQMKIVKLEAEMKNHKKQAVMGQPFLRDKEIYEKKN